MAGPSVGAPGGILSIAQSMVPRAQIVLAGDAGGRNKRAGGDHDDGGERLGRPAGRKSENNRLIVADILFHEAGHPVHTELPPLADVIAGAAAKWVSRHLAAISSVLSGHSLLLRCCHVGPQPGWSSAGSTIRMGT
jgi:hypothetical protein